MKSTDINMVRNVTSGFNYVARHGLQYIVEEACGFKEGSLFSIFGSYL